MARAGNLLPVILALAIGGLCAAEAAAGDVAPKASPPFSWTGFYAGIHAGYGSGDGNAAAVNPAALLPLFPGVNNLTSTASAPFTLGVEQSGWLGGLQAGYNWQSGRTLVGIEADVSIAGIGGQAARSYALRPVFLVGDFDDYTGRVKLTEEIDYFGTLRGRLGLANHSWLLYATGGLAWAHIKSSLESSHVRLTSNFPIPGFPAALDGQATASRLALGYAVGAGAEWTFAPQWSVKGEYLYLNFGHSVSLAIPSATLNGGTTDLHTFRVGLNRQLAP